MAENNSSGESLEQIANRQSSERADAVRRVVTNARKRGDNRTIVTRAAKKLSGKGGTQGSYGGGSTGGR